MHKHLLIPVVLFFMAAGTIKAQKEKITLVFSYKSHAANLMQTKPSFW
jgi:hypothetical protein